MKQDDARRCGSSLGYAGRKPRRYFGSTTDKILKGRYRGEVLFYRSGVGFERVAFVYGDTLDEMRRRKRILTQTLQEAHRESE